MVNERIVGRQMGVGGVRGERMEKIGDQWRLKGCLLESRIKGLFQG